MREVYPQAIKNTEVVSTASLPAWEKQQGVFTTLKVVHEIPLFLERHVKRLLTHALEMGIEPTITDIPGKIQQLLTANNILDGAVRISILEDNTVLFQATTLPDARKNIRAITYETREGLPRIKHIDRLVYLPAEENAKALDAETALFVSDGKFVESIYSNIVSMTPEGKLVTPPLAKEGLKGIMREVLLEKKVLHEAEIPFSTSQPLVLINSLRMHTVVTLNAIALPDPSSLTAIVAQYIAEEEKTYADAHRR